MAAFPNPAASLNFLTNSLNKSHFPPKNSTISFTSKKISRNGRNPRFLLQCTKFSTPSLASETESDYETEEDYNSTEEGYNSTEEYEEGVGNVQTQPPGNRRQRRRYRKQYPGEKKGITEEMRFVAMKLRSSEKSKRDDTCEVNSETAEEEIEDTWQPSMEGFLKYLVDSKLVFTTIERIVDESTDVSYVYFRKSGLERADCISRDLELLCGEGNYVIPQPSNPGVTYVEYLEELAEKSPPLFLCHFYNIYFSHIVGGQVIVRKVSKMLLGGRELEMYKWEGDAQELLRGVREKLNALAEHWSRDEKNRCLREATKAFRFLGQIVETRLPVAGTAAKMSLNSKMTW